MARSLGQVIASRELSHAASGAPVVVEIGVPRLRRTGEWACPYRIRGLKPAGVRRALGEDAVQALDLVFQAIRVELELYGSELSWLGKRGETGFSRFFPDVFGPKVRHRIHRLIDRELESEGRRLKRRTVKEESRR
jgi:hypothetical protein